MPRFNAHHLTQSPVDWFDSVEINVGDRVEAIVRRKRDERLRTTISTMQSTMVVLEVGADYVIARDEESVDDIFRRRMIVKFELTLVDVSNEFTGRGARVEFYGLAGPKAEYWAADRIVGLVRRTERPDTTTAKQEARV
jgi:hypothetical protein